MTDEETCPDDAAPAETADHTRARDMVLAALDGDGDDPKTARVLWCLNEMTSARWVSGKSHLECAERFKVSVRTAEGDAAEASRIIRILANSEDDLKALCVSALQHAMRMAEGDEMPAAGARAIAECVRVMSGLKGLDAPKKLEVDAGKSLADLLRLGVSGGKDDDE